MSRDMNPIGGLLGFAFMLESKKRVKDKKDMVLILEKREKHSYKSEY
jgi:hypothetical protein